MEKTLKPAAASETHSKIIGYSCECIVMKRKIKAAFPPEKDSGDTEFSRDGDDVWVYVDV